MVCKHAPGGAFTREHRLLEHLFTRHQRALVDARLACAAARWQRYRQHLATHIDAEEAWLDLIDESALRWPLKVYRAEHRRILVLADKITAQLVRVPRRASADYRIALLDRERTLKGVLEHHHEREELDLFPSLGGQQETN